MNCPNCGSNVNQGEFFCKVCGTKLPTIQNQDAPSNTTQTVEYLQPINNFQNESVLLNNTIDNQILIDAYIGNNADKLKNGGFSVNTFLFGILYIFYRKMWLLGFIILVSEIIINLFLPSLADVIIFAIDIIIAFQFKKIYLKHVEEEVENIKIENPGKTKEQLVMICSQKGGVSIIPIIIYALIYFLLFYAISSIGNAEKTNLKELSNFTTPQVTNLNCAAGSLGLIIPSIYELGFDINEANINSKVKLL